MPDLAQMTSDLRALPDQALQSELQNPTGLIPSYLVLAEAQRRQLMRQAAQKQQAQGQSGSVLDDVVRNMMAGQQPQGGPPAPAGMVSPQRGQQTMPGAMPPKQMGMAHGGALRYADGGESDDEDADIAAASPPMAELGNTQMPGVMSPSNVDSWITKYSRQHGVDPNMARAIMLHESGGRQSARGTKGDTGLFQLMPGTARDLGVDPNDPEQNVEGGIRYYSQLLKRYGGDRERALAAYNTGMGTVDKYGGVPPFGRNYVAAVLNKYNRLVGPYGTTAPTKQFLTDVKQSPKVTKVKEQPKPAEGEEWPPVEEEDLSSPPPPPAEEEEPSPSPSPPDEEEEPDQPKQAEEPEPRSSGQVFPGIAPGIQGMPESERQQIAAQLGTPPAGAGVTVAPSAAGPPASYIMPSAQPFNPYTPENIARQQQLYDTLTGGSPEMRRQMQMERQATVAQLQALRQDAINRYQNPSPWEFLSNIAAGMGSSHSLSLPMMFGQGVGLAWQQRDAAQDRALKDAEGLQQRIDAVTGQGETERQRMAGSMITMLGQQGKQPPGALSEYEKYLPMAKGMGPMDPGQAPSPGLVGIPDPMHPGYGIWVDPNQIGKPAKVQQPTGTFEKDFLPGWAEDNSTTVDKLTGSQRKQALADYHAAQADPHLIEAAKEIAQGIMEGTQPPDMKGLYRYGGQVRAILAKNGYNLTVAMRDWQNLNRYYTTLNGAGQLRLRQATEFVAQTIPSVRQLYQDWISTGLPTGFKEFNKKALQAATNLPGDAGTKAQLLLTQINDLTSEVGTMYKGGNSSTDESLRLAGENLKAEWSPKTFMAALTQLEKNVKIRRNSMASVAPMGVSPNSPYIQHPIPERPDGIPADAEDAQYSVKRRQWRYKPKGSNQWVVLPAGQ